MAASERAVHTDCLLLIQWRLVAPLIRRQAPAGSSGLLALQASWATACSSEAKGQLPPLQRFGPLRCDGPQPSHGGGGLPTVSGQLATQSSIESASGDAPTPSAAPQTAGISSIQRSLAGKQSRWSQLVASAAAGAGAANPKPQAAPTGSAAAGGGQSGTGSGHSQAMSSTRSLLDIGGGADAHAESSSNRSSADGRDDEVDENYFRPGGKGHQALLDNMDKRPSSGGSYQGSRGLDQLSSPMRSRVEIVARKSDHICVVRDVPDMRGSWYPRQQSIGPSSSGGASGGYQHQPGAGGGGSLDHPVPPQLQPPPIQPTSAQPVVAAPAKPSFAALFGKHPAIKEEPTTPGGTLTSDTPPTSGLGLAGKRGPFKGAQVATTPAPATTTSTTQISDNQLAQLMNLVTELKTELKQELGQLTKRVDSMDTSVGRVTQTVARLDRHCTAAASRQPAAAQQEPTATVAKQQPIIEHSTKSSDKVPTATSDSTKTRLSGSGQQLDVVSPAGAASDGSQPARERSKSPHRHHHHHHHHHHRKATHPTPTVSQTDLSQVGTSATSGKQLDTKTQSGSLARDPTRGPSLEQSDDDQDATSKL